MNNGELLIVLSIVRNDSIWSNMVFEKELISYSNNKWLLAWSLLLHFFKQLKAHIFAQQGCFFFHYSLATSMTNWVKMSTDLLFYALYVEVHVRILVFDNYQRCQVPLSPLILNLCVLLFFSEQTASRIIDAQYESSS